MRIDSYWSWEEQPAVLVNYENDSLAVSYSKMDHLIGHK